MRSPPVDQAERRYQFTAEKQIFGNREMLHQRKILIDDAHSEGPRGLRVRKLSGSAVYTNFAGVRLIEPGHDLDQRTLARPVSAEQRMHLATPHIEIDIFKRYDTWKCLAQSAQLEDHLTCTSGRRVQHLCCHRGALETLEFAVLAVSARTVQARIRGRARYIQRGGDAIRRPLHALAQPATLSGVRRYGPKATAHERDLAALRTIELEKEDISMWYDTLKYLV